MRPETVAERVWPGRPRRMEPLGGGITNENFRVDVDGARYVLRIAGRNTDLLGIDRRAEREATLAASRAGVGPDVVAFVEPEGYLVTRFIEGRPVPPEEMRSPDRLEQAASALKAIHEGPPVPGRFHSFRIVEAYAETAAAHGVERPAAFDRAHEIAGRIERTRRAERERPCHNDLLNANFLDDGERLRIVDWEYAGMGDRFFDLANFSINHELGEEENELLLAGYFEHVGAHERDALTLMRFMSDFREAMWGVVQRGISSLEFDFAAYAEEHFQRLDRTAAEPRFREALERSRP